MFLFVKRCIRRPFDAIFITSGLIVVIFLYWNMTEISKYNMKKPVNQKLSTFNMLIQKSQIDLKKLWINAGILSDSDKSPENKEPATRVNTKKLEEIDDTVSYLAKIRKNRQIDVRRIKLKTKTRRVNSEPKLDPENVFRDGSVLSLAQNDSRLLEFIQENHLIPPSKEPYYWTQFPTGDPTYREIIGAGWRIVLKLLENRTNGFLVESGTNDRDFLLSTLALERYFGWTGVLIEGDPHHVKDLLVKNRNVWIVDTFLSGEPYPKEVQMQRHRGWSDEYFVGKYLPIFSILSAMNVFEVDCFMMDIESFDLAVLKTIPFDSVFIKVFMIQISGRLDPKVVPFIESKGYICIRYIHSSYTRDYIFIHRNLWKDEMKKVIGEEGCYWWRS